MTEENKPIRKPHPLFQQLMHYASIIGAVGTVIFLIWAYHKGLFQSRDSFAAYINQAGIWGPPLFIFIQILQTVVPIIPGALTSVAGVYIYNPLIGNIYNYIGIVIGSIINFHMARIYGQQFVQSLVKPRTYKRYVRWLDEGDRFDRFFIFMMIFPVSPADFLCLLAGLTKMTYRKFILIILICKPFTLAAYTLGLTALIEWGLSLFAIR